MADDGQQDAPTHAPLHRAMSGLKPKGILKNAPTPLQTPGGTQHLQWDEQNIALTEAEKETMNRMKITEPKTPFVHSVEIENLGEDDIESDIPNLDLDHRSGSGSRASSSVGSPISDAGAKPASPGPRGTTPEASSDHGSRRASFSSSAGGSTGRPAFSNKSGSGTSSRSTSFSLPTETVEERLHVHPGDRFGLDEDRELDASALAKKRAFEMARDRHYSHEAEAMKQPLNIEPDEDEDIDMEGDSAVDDEEDEDVSGGIPPVPPLPKLNGSASV